MKGIGYLDRDEPRSFLVLLGVARIYNSSWVSSVFSDPYCFQYSLVNSCLEFITKYLALDSRCNFSSFLGLFLVIHGSQGSISAEEHDCCPESCNANAY